MWIRRSAPGRVPATVEDVTAARRQADRLVREAQEEDVRLVARALWDEDHVRPYSSANYAEQVLHRERAIRILSEVYLARGMPKIRGEQPMKYPDANMESFDGLRP